MTATLSKTENDACWEDVGKPSPGALQVGMSNGAAAVGNSLEVLKINTELLHEPGFRFWVDT